MTERTGSSCLSELVLDRFFVGELDLAQADTVRGHAATCARCSERLAERDACQASFERDAGLDLRVRATERTLRGNRTARWALASAATAAAAALLLYVALPRRPEQTREPTVRRKGGLSLGILAKRLDGRIEAVTSPAELAPGEAIQFSVSTSSAGYLAIVGVDSAGAVTPYMPVNGPTMRVAAGRDQLLEGSIVLDATLGAERIVAVLCQDEMVMDEMIAQARAALTRAGGDPARIDSLALAATCSQTSFLIDKARRAPGVE